MSSGLRFERPMGAAADVKELEFVIALHQTCNQRTNATVSSHDIWALLRSRYGLLNVTQQETLDICACFGGDPLVHDDDAHDREDRRRAWREHAMEAILHPQQPSQPPESSQQQPQKLDDMVQRLDILHGQRQQGIHHQASLEQLQTKVQHQLRQTVLLRTKEHLRRPLRINHEQTDYDSDDSVESMEIQFANAKADEEQEEQYDAQGLAAFAPYEFVSHDNNNNNNKSLTLEEEIALQDIQHQITTGHNHNDSRKSQTAKYASGEPTETTASMTRHGSSLDNGMQSNNGETTLDVNDKHVVGYLDMVQIVSTILLPTVARLAHEFQNEPDTTQLPQERNAEKEDTSATTINSNTASPWQRLGQRCMAYGRRKVGISDENRPQKISGHNFLKTSQLALLKTVTLVEDEQEPAPQQQSSKKDQHGTNQHHHQHIQAPVVDEALVQLLLISHGELERANDPQLVRDMVLAASSTSGLLDEESICNAITSDVKSVWDATCENHGRTFLYDVLGEHFPALDTKLRLNAEDGDVDGEATRLTAISERPTTKDIKTLADIESLVDQESAKEKDPLANRGFFFKFWPTRSSKGGDFSFLFGGVDMVIDAASSSLIFILIWLSFVFFVLLYATLSLAENVNLDCSDNEWWCLIAGRLCNWLVVSALLLFCGVALVLPLSIGNNPAGLTPGRMGFSMIYAVSNALVPYLVTHHLEMNLSDVSDIHIDDLIGSAYYESAQKALVAVGFLLALLYFCLGMFTFFVGHERAHGLPPLLRLMFAATSYTGEVRVFRAAKFKAERLVSNALGLHELGTLPGSMDWKEKVALSSATDPVMRNFICNGERYEKVGGLLFCLWRLVDGSLLDEEGIWIHTRLLVIQAAQVGIGFFIAVLLGLLEAELGSEADQLRSTLDPYNLPDYIMQIFPTSQMVHTALAPAMFISCSVMAFIVALYVPSSIATVLKFRGGILSSLRSASFQKYRNGVDYTYVNTANALYGVAFMAILIYLASGLFIFLFVWPVSKSGMIYLFTTGVGIAITVGIKIVVTAVLNKRQYRSFYRIRPAAARVTSLALECWQLGLASTIAAIRIFQYLASAIFWVGRIDTRFLSEDVVLGGMDMDTVPKYYIQDLLIHEAHRHPYIERLCQMYLMKIRYGDRFISPAGSAWRQLLVSAVFPWLQKYRVFRDERRYHARQENKEIDDIKQEENEPFVGVREVRDGVVHAGQSIQNEMMDLGEELASAQSEVANGIRLWGTRGSTRASEQLLRRQRENDAHNALNHEPYGLTPSWN